MVISYQIQILDGVFFILRLFSILTLLIIEIEFWYQKSLFNMRQISDRFYMIKQSQIISFSLVIHVVHLEPQMI